MRKKKRPPSSGVTYRDKKDVQDRTRADVAFIAASHMDPDHPDYNPGGATQRAARGALYEVIKTQQSRSRGGKARAEDQRKDTLEADKRILEEYERQVNAPVPKRRLIGATARALQASGLSEITERRVRRAVERGQKKDTS